MRVQRSVFLASALVLISSMVSAFPLRARPKGAPAEVGASWSYTNYGSGIGLAGIVRARNGGFLELYAGGSLNDFGGNDYWYVLRYSSLTHQYEQVFTSEPMPSKIVRIATAQLSGDGRTQIVVALESGEVRLYDQTSRQSLPGLSVVAGIQAMAIHDLDGDGVPELLFTSPSGLSVFSSAGVSLWNAPSAIGVDIAVGQMDDDAALEIATTGGFIVDAATHAVEWNAPQGFGFQLRVGDIDGDGREELIVAEPWSAVRAYDVDAKLEKWTIPTPLDVGAIGLFDTDCDGRLEVLIGDGQFGSVRSYDAETQALRWEIPNPQDGVTWIEFGDLDGFGNGRVIWGAGNKSTGPDYLYFGNTVTQSIEWQSLDLSGPFLGPEIGDVDGDGKPELVFVTRYSDAQYAGPRIVVLDAETLRFRAMSEPLGSLFPIPSLLLRNVDADPALEIVLAGGAPYDGVVQIYDFTAPGTFTLNWDNGLPPFGSWFWSVDTGDADGGGALKILAGGGRAHTGADGTFFYVYDYATGALDWTSPQIGGYWDDIQDVAIVAGGPGAPDLLGIVAGGSLYGFDGATHAALPVVSGAFTTMRAAPFSGVRTIYLGDGAGKVYRYERDATTYTLAATYTLGLARIDGITLPTSGGFLIGSSGRLRFYTDLNAAPVWTSLDFGDYLGTHACIGIGPHARVLSGGLYGVFEVGPSLTVSTVSPTSGPASGGTAVAVAGGGFSAGASAFVDDIPLDGVVVEDSANLSGTTPALTAGALVSLTVLDVDGSEGALHNAFFADFLDVDGNDLYHDSVETIFRRGVTGGCGNGLYCGAQPITRSQMAVFLVRGGFGAAFLPPKARGGMFNDVSCGDFAADEIEWIGSQGVTVGCGGGAFCGDNPVTRDEMAVFLLKTLEGSAYVPPPAQGVFDDVPAGDPFAPWIEDLAARGITAGCDSNNYCPTRAVTREEMAAFVSLTFFAP